MTRTPKGYPVGFGPPDRMAVSVTQAEVVRLIEFLTPDDGVSYDDLRAAGLYQLRQDLVMMARRRGWGTQ